MILRSYAQGSSVLPEQPDSLLAERAGTLDVAWRTVSRGLTAGGDINVDAEGRMHLGKDDVLESRPAGETCVPV